LKWNIQFDNFFTVKFERVRNANRKFEGYLLLREMYSRKCGNCEGKTLSMLGNSGSSTEKNWRKKRIRKKKKTNFDEFDSKLFINQRKK
jgi:hypothetical protein